MKYQNSSLRTVAFFLFAALFLTTGCSTKNEVTELFTPDKIYEKALVYTRQEQIVRDLETKAAIDATLLNEVFPREYPYDKGVFFFVGIVTDLDKEDFKKGYHITLNGMKPVKIEKVKESDDLYKLMPNVNSWGRYFVVTFPPTEAKKLVIDFGVDPYGSVQLPFQRPTRR
ncbi:hypothetical protein [Hydrogenimonas sp. SS33]|uniref:hypothetical protein n=1 Tax=Hydrogenimonas leucolamina TaxID=2954236 RepID=UPI00336C2FD8